jgi:hypothetical protein
LVVAFSARPAAYQLNHQSDNQGILRRGGRHLPWPPQREGGGSGRSGDGARSPDQKCSTLTQKCSTKKPSMVSSRCFISITVNLKPLLAMMMDNAMLRPNKTVEKIQR